jgi:hypothetical protein
MPVITRRNLVTQAGALAAGAALAPITAIAAATPPLDVREVALGSGFTLAKMRALLNQTFYLHTSEGAVLIAQLVEVRERVSKVPSRMPMEQFSAIFQGPLLPVLPSDTYVVEHWLAGRVPLYLSAIPQARYRADFSILL